MKPFFRHLCFAAVLLSAVSPASGYASPAGLPLNVNARQIANNDTLAWSLIGVLGLTLGMVTACGLGIYRQFRRATPETDLIEEIKRQARQPGPVHIPPAPKLPQEKSWERPADWWKGPPQD